MVATIEVRAEKEDEKGETTEAGLGWRALCSAEAIPFYPAPDKPSTSAAKVALAHYKWPEAPGQAFVLNVFLCTQERRRVNSDVIYRGGCETAVSHRRAWPEGRPFKEPSVS